MAHADFVHLRVHTAFSLLEGAIKVKDLVETCGGLSMPAVAMTDTSNLFGALEFSQACAGDGIQPIIGCQLLADFSAEAESDPLRPHNGNGDGHNVNELDQIVLLVQDEAGYLNLLSLVSKAHLETDAGSDPHVTLQDLEIHNEGLIALTGGVNGGVGRLLVHGQYEAAEELLETLSRMYGGRLYVELQRHGLEDESRIEEDLLDLAYKHNLPIVATNECFFLGEDMYEAHDALICIAEGAYVGQTGRRRLTPDHRFKPAQEMRALFADLPEAIDNTLVIARRCAFMAETRDPLLPAAPHNGDERPDSDVLADLAADGLIERLRAKGLEGREGDARPYWERLEYELAVIAKMGFPGYFLIVADFIKWAKSRDIPVGPGRGSGAGSVVAWSLTITDLDPLQFGLLFERFLNPERVSMPDFDIDFCQDRRDEVIAYVQEKYGADRVAQIITFGTLQPRAALRDVGRVLQMPYPQVDRICKLVPNNPAAPVTLQEAIDGEPQLQQAIQEDETVARLVEIAKKLEGLYRHASTHAAGLVIGDRPLVELVPLYRDPRSDMPVTQFSMKWVEAAGLVKFDFLGLKTLTVLSKSVELLHQRGVELDLACIPLDDRATFEMLGRGETTGVFQMESSGVRDILRNMKPDSFEDVIAIVALYRPGPMDNIPSYIKRKHGEEEPDYLYPNLESILTETYGIMIYQEQVLQIAQELAGYTLGSADLLRRAMGKKIKAEMDAQRKTFVDGAAARGVPDAKASSIFDQVAKFAGYGFNKSHAAAYALVAYQTAYLKANYPVEFLAASMTLDIHNTDKLGVFRQEIDRLGLELLPPDINASGSLFSVEHNGETGAIRYALAAIRNVGEAAMRSLVEDRTGNGRFESIQDFAGRLDNRSVNKRSLENLIRAGVFDGINPNRKQIFECAEAIVRQAGAAADARNSDQIGLFGDSQEMAVALTLPDIPDWTDLERLNEEVEAIGLYISAHPLDAYEVALERLRAKSYKQFVTERPQGMVSLAGVVTAKRERTSARGSKYAFVQMTDKSGAYEVTVFSEILNQSRELLEPGNILLVKAAPQYEGETVRLTAQKLEPLDAVAANAAAGLKIYVDGADPLSNLNDVLDREGAGRGEVLLISRVDLQTEVEIRLPGKFKVSPQLAQAVRSIPGIVDAREF